MLVEHDGSADRDAGPFAHLGLEHARFAKVLRLLERWLDAHDAQAGDHEDFETIVDYLALFADLGHQDKEEGLLSAALIKDGFDWYDGPIARMRAEHQQERYLLRSLTQLARQRAPWSQEDERHLASLGREFLAFMRAHVDFENREIYAPAEQRLSPETRRRLLAAFEKCDAERAESTDERQVRERLEPLFEKYGA